MKHVKTHDTQWAFNKCEFSSSDEEQDKSEHFQPVPGLPFRVSSKNYVFFLESSTFSSLIASILSFLSAVRIIIQLKFIFKTFLSVFYSGINMALDTLLNGQGTKDLFEGVFQLSHSLTVRFIFVNLLNTDEVKFLEPDYTI